MISSIRINDSIYQTIFVNTWLTIHHIVIDQMNKAWKIISAVFDRFFFSSSTAFYFSTWKLIESTNWFHISSEEKNVSDL